MAEGVRWRRPERPELVYVGLCGVVLLAVTRFVVERNWGGDYWEHAAAAVELAQHPLAPSNPYTGTPGDSVLLDTWHLLVGFLSRTGLGVQGAFVVAAVVQLIAVLAALRSFARHFVRWTWAGPCFLVATLLFWGWQPWRWSGFLDFNGLGFVISYPSTGATALMLWGAVALDRWVNGGVVGDAVVDDRGRHVGRAGVGRRDVIVALGCMLVIADWSPMTLLPAAVLVVAIVLSPGGRDVRSRVLMLGAMAVVALIGLLSTRVPPAEWPAVGEELGIPMQLLFADVPTRVALASPGAIGLVIRVRRTRQVDAPAIALALGTIGYVVGWRANIPNLGRLLIPVMSCLHLGWVELMWWAAQRSRQRRRAAIAGFAAVAILGLVGAYGALARVLPPVLLPERVATDERQALPERTTLREVSPHLNPGDVVADTTYERPAVFVLAGARVLYTSEDPLLPDKDGRLEAMTAIAAGGPAALGAIDRHGVTAVWCSACAGVLAIPGATVVAEGTHGTLVRVEQQ